MNPTMAQAGMSASPMLLERFELKFLIPHRVVSEMEEYLRQFCSIDPHAGPDDTYRINTLYMDSPNFLFFRRRMNGDDGRFNIRFRGYGDAAQPPYLVEIKYKRNGVIKKFRHIIPEELWRKHFCESETLPFNSEMGMKDDNYELFERLALTYNIEPKILTSYERKAYVSDIDSYARVTFDKNLRFQFEDRYNLAIDDNAMSHYDNPTFFPEGCDTVLELKCTTQVPLWMIDFIRNFRLQRSRFSKYAFSLSEMQGVTSINRFDRMAHMVGVAH